MTIKTGRLEVDQWFDLELVLDGTQDFRWRAWEGGWLSGVLSGHVVHVRQAGVGASLEYRANVDLESVLRSYFRLDEDIAEVRDFLSDFDDTMRKLVNRFPYLRILRQPDPWQATVSYICSANNNIKRTSDLVEKVACLSDRRVELGGDVRHAFPTPSEVLARKEKVECARLGLNRAEGILDAAARVSGNSLDLQRLRQPDVSHDEARDSLKAVMGIGPKVADCISLFSLDKGKAFPMDTWVERALEYYYPDQKPTDLRECLGERAGYVSQLLFRDALTRQVTLTRPPTCQELASNA